jgi:hypothetical protein
MTPTEMEYLPHPIGKTTDQWPSTIRRLNPAEITLLQLSNDMSEQRISLTRTARDEDYWRGVLTIISILVGGITTILVALISTEMGREDTSVWRATRIIAIIFTTLGTAMAGLIGFYNPQGEWAQATRILSNVTNLDNDVAMGLWKVKCSQTQVDDDSAQQLSKSLENWTRQYNAIITIANANGAQNNVQGGSTNEPLSAPK